MKKESYLILIFLLISFSCSNEDSFVEPKIEIDDEPDAEISETDILSRELKDGIFLSCDSLYDFYTLDQMVIGHINLDNISNEEGLHVSIGNYPPFLSWRISDSNDKLITAEPTIIGFLDYDDTLKIGENLNEKLKWYHHIWDPNEIYSGLKAFSGVYDLRITFRGIQSELEPYLIKQFEITEEGEPLSTHLYRYYDVADSINYDFIVRNRITKDITLTNSQNENYIFFFDESKKDTVFKYSFLLENPVYNLRGHSDNVLVKFRHPKEYFLNNGITGAFNIIIKLNFVERNIIDENMLFILR